MDLKATPLRHLEATPKSYAQIAKEIGVTERWVYYLADGRYDDPGVKKIQRLYTYLTGKEIKLKEVQ